MLICVPRPRSGGGWFAAPGLGPDLHRRLWPKTPM